MTLRISFALSATLFCATVRAADPTPLNVKTGEWESTLTGESTGQLPIPQEMLDKLTPDQRAKMEAMMKARGMQGPRTTVYKSCLRKEDLTKAAFGNDETQKSCKQTIVNSSSTTREFRMDCEMEGGKQTGTFKFEAVDSTTVKGTMHMTASNGGRTMNINNNFSAKWLGPTCSESNK